MAKHYGTPCGTVRELENSEQPKCRQRDKQIGLPSPWQLDLCIVSLPHSYSRMLKDVAHSFIVSISTSSLLGSSMSHWHHSREHPLTSCNTHSRWYGRNGLREQIPWSQAGPWGNMEQRQIQQFSLPSDAEWFRNSGVVEKFCQIRNLQWTPHLRSVTLNFLMNIILMTPQQSGSIPRSSTEWQTAGTIRGFSHLPCNARHMRQDPCESLQEKTSEEWSSLANLLLVWEAAKCC